MRVVHTVDELEEVIYELAKMGEPIHMHRYNAIRESMNDEYRAIKTYELLRGLIVHGIQVDRSVVEELLLI